MEVTHRVSSVGNPHSNNCGELSAKSLKDCCENMRLDIHTKVLKELEIGDCFQIQNLRGKHPFKSDRAGVVTAKNGFSNYSVKIFESGLVRNRASLRKVNPRSVQRGQN